MINSSKSSLLDKSHCILPVYPSMHLCFGQCARMAPNRVPALITFVILQRVLPSIDFVSRLGTGSARELCFLKLLHTVRKWRAGNLEVKKEKIKKGQKRRGKNRREALWGLNLCYVVELFNTHKQKRK